MAIGLLLLSKLFPDASLEIPGSATSGNFLRAFLGLIANANPSRTSLLTQCLNFFAADQAAKISSGSGEDLKIEKPSP